LPPDRIRDTSGVMAVSSFPRSAREWRAFAWFAVFGSLCGACGGSGETRGTTSASESAPATRSVCSECPAVAGGESSDFGGSLHSCTLFEEHVPITETQAAALGFDMAGITSLIEREIEPVAKRVILAARKRALAAPGARSSEPRGPALVGLPHATEAGMRLPSALTFLSVLATPVLAVAAQPGASGTPMVAPEPHRTDASEPEAAQPGSSSTTPARTPAMRKQWYGWQSLSADGAALLLLIAAGASSDQKGHTSDVLGYGALGLYLVGGPVTHFARGNTGRGLGSLALRAGLPIVSGAVGSRMEDCSGDNDYDLCGLPGAILGGVVGIATAITLDATLLSYDEAPVRSQGVQNVAVSIGSDRAVLVAGGTF